MYSRPALPPLRYRLWLPALLTYVRETDLENRRITGTTDENRAVELEEPEARRQALDLIKATGWTVELRRPGDAPPALTPARRDPWAGLSRQLAANRLAEGRTA